MWYWGWKRERLRWRTQERGEGRHSKWNTECLSWSAWRKNEKRSSKLSEYRGRWKSIRREEEAWGKTGKSPRAALIRNLRWERSLPSWRKLEEKGLEGGWFIRGPSKISEKIWTTKISPTAKDKTRKRTKIMRGNLSLIRGAKKMSWSRLRMAQNTPEEAWLKWRDSLQ